MIYEVSFPDNNGSGIFHKALKNNGVDSEITIEYSFNALSSQHIFTITNNDFTVKDIIGSAGCVLNLAGLYVCNLFAILHSPAFNGMCGYVDELPAGSTKLYIVDKTTLLWWLENMRES